MPPSQVFETVQSLIASEAGTLSLAIGQYGNIKPGQEIPKSDAQKAPVLSFRGANEGKTYIVIGLDIDAPFPSFGVLGPILHWIQPGLKPKHTPDGIAALEASATPFVANYIGPAPPPFSSAHRYVFLLYDQPADFDGKRYAPPGGAKLGNWPRTRYNLNHFEKEAKLGPVIAANYFRSN